MIDTSSAYKQMMLGRKVHSRMTAKITSGNSVYNLSSDDIVRNSLSINWRSSNNRSFSLGTCYVTSLSFSSFVSVEPRLDGEYIIIEPTVYYQVDLTTEVAFPLGKFRCDEPKVMTKITSYECYDSMIAFDKKVETRFSGTPFNVLTYICRKCDMDFALTAQQVAHMPNSSQTVIIDPARVVSYRDAISYVSMILGGYCIIDREGKLTVRNFHSEPDLELVRMRRESTSFGGYKTCFCGVKCRFLANQNFYPYEEIDELAEGIIVDLGDIPIIEADENTKHAILQNIYNLISDIEYYPCDIDMVGDPSIEAGDMIRTKDKYGYDRNILLTSVTYQWRQTANILSEGANPKMENVTTAQKKQQASQDEIAKANTVITATYANANGIEVDDTDEVEVTNLRFTTNRDLTAIFGAEIPCYSDGDGYVTITYVNNGIDADSVVARVHEGYNLITLVNHLYYDGSMVVLLQLMAETSGIGSDSAPTVTIDQDKIRSYIFAQGIEVEAPWDGIIQISEDIGYGATTMALYGITDGCSVVTVVPEAPTLADVVAAVTAGVQTYGISDTMSLDVEYGDWVLKMGMGHLMGMGRMLAPYQVT